MRSLPKCELDIEVRPVELLVFGFLLFFRGHRECGTVQAGTWFVGEILRFEGERVLIERQQKGMNLAPGVGR
jgi:hypothetical protein